MDLKTATAIAIALVATHLFVGVAELVSPDSPTSLVRMALRFEMSQPTSRLWELTAWLRLTALDGGLLVFLVTLHRKQRTGVSDG